MSDSPGIVRAHAGSCSFCNASSAEVRGLASAVGKEHRVCDRCIERCIEVLGQGAEGVAAIRADLARATAAGDAVAIATLQRTIDTNDGPHPVLPDGVACSFCDRVVMSRKKILAGPTLYICDVCIAAAGDLLGA